MVQKIDDRIAAAIELAKIGFYSYRFDGTIETIDAVTFNFFELEGIFKDPESLVGRNIDALFNYTGPKGRLRSEIQKKGRVTGVEYGFKTLKGKEKWGIHNSYQHVDKETGKKLIQVCFYDITERKLAEQALAQEKERLWVTLTSIGDGVITTDRNGRVTLINKNAEKLTGWTQAEADEKNIDEIFNTVHMETRQKCENPVKKILETKRVVRLSTAKNLISRHGKERIITDSGAPIFDSKNEFIGVVLVFQDVTQNYKIETQLQQSQKMEAIGVLAGGIAHDFNNMLAVIMGNISYAMHDLNKDDELYKILSGVITSSNQAQSLTQQLLTFAKGGEPIKKVSDINSLLKDSAIFSTRGAMTNCNFELSGELFLAEVDQGQFNQVMSNLFINANQAMPNGGTITIRTENTIIDDESDLPLSPGPYIKLGIEDQGVGISRKHLSKIFDPYFTTKQKGSGLGLSTTYSIIKKHGGHITVYSEIERGTIFQIYLPATGKKDSTPQRQIIQKHEGQGKILIMDDHEPILDMAQKILNHLGYKTVVCMDGLEAVEKYREAYSSDDPFDIVILDLTVPGGMGGVKTVIELLKINPDVKAVVSSGYSNDPIMANCKDYGFCGVLPKPYTTNQMSLLFNTIFSENT